MITKWIMTDNKKEAQRLRMFYARINIDSKIPQHLTGHALHNRSDQLWISPQWD